MSYSQEDHREKKIGQKKWLVPQNLLKITYRKGIGKPPQSGDTIKAYTKCQLINGNEIFSRTLKQYTIGQNRLIEGLQIAFKQTLLHQKFTLMVSPEYGYLYNDTQTDGVIPTNQKLIFQFQIQEIITKTFQSKDNVDKLFYIQQLYKKAGSYLETNQPYKAIKVLDSICQLIQENRKFLQVYDLALMKKACILCQLKRYEDALTINQIAYKNQNSQRVFLVHSEIYLKLQNKQKSRSVMQRYFHIYGRIHRCRRVYVQYLKRIQQFAQLRNLQGYDFHKDKIVNIVRRPERDFYPFFMRGFF